MKSALVAGWVLALCGCGSNAVAPADAGRDGPHPCQGDEDCGPGEICGGAVCRPTPRDGGLDGGTAGLTVTPEVLDFGSPLLGQETVRTVRLGNVGAGPVRVLSVTLLDPEEAGELTFAAPATPVAVMPGDEIPIAVTLLPRNRVVDRGFLVITTDEAAQPSHVVHIISSMKGVPWIELCALEAAVGSGCVPGGLDFGVVPYGGSASGWVAVRNAGDGNAVIAANAVLAPEPPVVPAPLFALELLAADPATPGATVPVTLPFLLVPGDATTPPTTLYARVTFSAATDREIPDLLLVVRSDNVDAPQAALPIFYRLSGCPAGYVDRDGDRTNGCEYECTETGGGVEVCDGLDNDCDGEIDEGFDLMTDLANCGVCGHACGFAHAAASCVAGSCDMGDCAAGWHDANGKPSDGCEYPCTETNGGVEICDGLDNNCDGHTDEGVIQNSDPGNCGGCGVVCTYAHAAGVCNLGICERGACESGWGDANNDASDGCECAVSNGGVEICDLVDNNCDGFTDEGFDLTLDVNHCGACNHACVVPFGTPGCVDSQCVVVACDPGHVDKDHVVDNGCECAPTTEVCDGLDNDCDGETDESGFTDTSPTDTAHCGACYHACGPGVQCFSGSCLVPGLVVISEMMINPKSVSDEVGEWFEVYNPGAFPVNLKGWTIKDLGIDVHDIPPDVEVLVPPAGFAVLGKVQDVATNGGIPVAYQYNNFFLANSDEIVLVANGVEIDRVVYTSSWVTEGASKELKRSQMNATANNTAANWCTATTPISASNPDKGTPGYTNDCP
jgi:hypothetical protein